MQLLAFVQVSAEGQPETVSSAALPGTNAPAAFQKVAEYALRQARFGSDAAPRTYCLLVRFAPEATAPRLAWLPGAARDASRCLAGAMPLAPREIDLAAAPR